MLLLALFTVIVVVFLLGAFNVSRTPSVIIGILVGFGLYSRYVGKQNQTKKTKKDYKLFPKKENNSIYLEDYLKKIFNSLEKR